MGGRGRHAVVGPRLQNLQHQARTPRPGASASNKMQAPFAKQQLAKAAARQLPVRDHAAAASRGPWSSTWLTSITHCMHGKKWALSRIVSCARGYMFFLQARASRRLLRFERFRCSAPHHAAGFLRDRRRQFARRCAVETTLSAKLPGTRVLVSHKNILQYPVSAFSWRTSRYWAEY